MDLAFQAFTLTEPQRAKLYRYFLLTLAVYFVGPQVFITRTERQYKEI